MGGNLGAETSDYSRGDLLFLLGDNGLCKFRSDILGVEPGCAV